jgi:hypothetical protein
VSDGDEGVSDEAAKLFGAADAVLEAAGFPRFAWLMQEFEEAVAAASERSAESPELRASNAAGRAAGVELAQEWVARSSE